MIRFTLRLLAAGVGLLLLAGCGKDDGGAAAPGPAGGGPAEAPFTPDDVGWPEAAAGEGWELAGWIPQGARIEGRRVDPSFLRAHGAWLHTRRVWFDTVRAWTRWVRELGLPEDGFRDVIIVTEPESFHAYLPALAPATIDAALRAKGYVEQALSGARAFIAPEAEFPTIAWIDDRLVLTSGEPALLERLIALRGGREPSARAMPAVEAAVRAVGPGLPVEVEASEQGLGDSPPGAPTPLASVGRLEPAGEVHEIRALALRTEDDAAAFRAYLEKMFAGLALREVERPHLGVRGAVLRLTTSAALERLGRSPDGGIRNDLGSLERALERYRAEHGHLPTAGEGLAALARVPGCLDEFLGAQPRDPWGRPYAYQPDHPKRPGGFVLRSLGPDGEIDTEDDVLPDE